MCIIAFQPHGKEISREILSRCWSKNPHGGGFTYSNGERMIVVKELRSFEHYWKHLARHADAIQAAKSPVLHHFRWATHGKKDLRNCHPFLVDSKLSFAHNGIFTWIKDDNVVSDTYIFNRDILKPLPKGFIYNQSIVTLLDDYVGYNKLVFLDVHGGHVIINEKEGEWSEGVWYSNSNYKETTYTGTSKSWSGHSAFSEGEKGCWVTEKTEEGKWQTRYIPPASDDDDPWPFLPGECGAAIASLVPERIMGKGSCNEVSREAQTEIDSDTVKVDAVEGAPVLCDYCGGEIKDQAVIWSDQFLHTYCRRELENDMKNYGRGCC